MLANSIARNYHPPMNVARLFHFAWQLCLLVSLMVSPVAASVAEGGALPSINNHHHAPAAHASLATKETLSAACHDAPAPKRPSDPAQAPDGTQPPCAMHCLSTGVNPAIATLKIEDFPGKVIFPDPASLHPDRPLHVDLRPPIAA